MNQVDHHLQWRTFIEKEGLHGLVNIPFELFDKIPMKDLRLKLINAKQVIEGLLKETGLWNDE